MLLDRLTVASIAVVAYCAANLLHEGAGHGVACVLIGGRPITLNAIFFDCDYATAAPRLLRWGPAAGSIVNLIVAAMTVGVARLWRGAPSSFCYFGWLFVAINLLMVFGYLLFSGLGGFGDWARVIEGLPGQPALRAAEAVVGAALYFVVAPRLLWPALQPHLGGETSERVARARTLTLLPYLVGGSVFLAAGLRNPIGWQITLLSAVAASFGGTSLLAWYFVMRAGRPDGTTGPGRGIPRSLPWILAATLTLALFVGLFGPGLSL